MNGPTPLPYVGVITNGTDDVGAVANRYLPLAGKKVLCIGLSETGIADQVAVYGPASITSMTLWPDHIDAETKAYELVIGDITKRTAFADNTFDAVITESLLEHVNPLGDALLEMKRITRRSGVVVSRFGPTWSSAYGHHLYVIDPTDPLLNFSLWQMPAYMHLLWSRSEIAEFYRTEGYTQQQAQEIVRTMFEWDGINRAMMREYMYLFGSLFQIEYLETMYTVVDQTILKRLQEKYPDNIDFTTYGAKVVLRNNLK
jgi:SAM-dependent methyltransferase